MATANEERGVSVSVCVTGAGGYVASWLVKLLLSKGYIVHGTVRSDTGDERNAHLKNLEKASENLKLFKADVLNYNSMCVAITGCTGVFHVASPVPSSTLKDEADFFEPAVTGTLNVLKACSEMSVKRVVVVSSIAAVGMNHNWPKDQAMDESCWSDKEYCKEDKSWYCLSKTAAESEAFEYAKKSGLDIVSLCPCLVIGPLLQSIENASSSVLIQMLKDGVDTIENKPRKVVDVRDVAEALLLTYEKPGATGRYICISYVLRTRDLVEKIRSMYPDLNYPRSYITGGEDEKYSTKKLQNLGWKYRPLEETLIDSVESYQKHGLLNTI